ncbi:MAG: L,D-transpeptidase family protein [Kiritimatiellia bacterium]
MQPQTPAPPDIYLMKREKSRAGCMTLLIVAAVLLAIAAAAFLVRWYGNRGAEPAPPVEFPEAPIESEIPPVHMPEMPLPIPVADPPAPAPVPTVPVPAEAPPATSVPAAPAPEPAAPATAAAPGDADQLLAQARERLQAGDPQAARQAALDALAARPGDAQIESFLGDLAMPLLASQRPMPEKVEYVVQSGDYLGKLAATFNTPVALIAKANNIQGANIRVGETLRLLDGNRYAFALTASKSRNDLVVALDGKFFKRYRISTGENAKTPAGTFKITDKIERPVWHKPGGRAIPYGDPENELGTHWLALDLPGYGLHGTWDPDSIGKQSSAGCVRLLNADIEELYTILPKGTLVTVVE